MKVLLLNGSPNKKGTTYKALLEMQQTFEKEGIESEIIHVCDKEISGCKACYACFKTGKCVLGGGVNELANEFEKADGLVLGSPVYYASANGTFISFLDRLFYSTHFDKTMKVGASVACARRGGITATHDQLNKYFTISGMPIASGQYWNGLHGGGEKTTDDKEGFQQMRTLAKNMSFLLKSIAIGKEKFGLPEKEKKEFTNFIR